MLKDMVTDGFNCHVTLDLSFNTDPYYLLLLLEQEVDAIGQEVDTIGQEEIMEGCSTASFNPTFLIRNCFRPGKQDE